MDAKTTASREAQLPDVTPLLDADDAIAAWTARLRETRHAVGVETIQAFCRKLAELQWRIDHDGVEESDLIAALCTALACATLDGDVRRHVRNEGGLKTLVQLLKRKNSTTVLSAATHALMNLAVDAVNKNALRACGVIEQSLELLSDSRAAALPHLFGCLGNLIANNFTNAVAMIDADLPTKLRGFAAGSGLDSRTQARVGLVLTALQVLQTPLQRRDDHSLTLYDIFKNEKSQDPQHLSNCFEKWRLSEESETPALAGSTPVTSLQSSNEVV